jgi:DNA polymerase I-like protein with 3'-5' exonuclease and polymerase domains
LAIATLPQYVADMMMMPVHDELVFNVPASAIGEVEPLVVKIMEQAGNVVLGGIIPVVADPGVAKVWMKN